ncbi:UNVERIFIED_CONTAM: hypothetical protein Sangu_2337800 [Sesamum angustifolium]|uniref:CCHC-type domain-containing protein n=1 Tax=Sesamum angustifolium TaxID=2727405 RepID=A0AAW2L8L3_9LAMI
MESKEVGPFTGGLPPSDSSLYGEHFESSTFYFERLLKWLLDCTSNLDDTGHYLVGRLLTTKTVRFESLRDLLQSVINPIKGMELKAIENNRFLFRFNHSVDKNRALEGCPWSFEKNVLILNEVGDNENPLTVNLDWCSFYVHVHELPIRKTTKDFARYIGNRMGRFVDMEHMDHHRNWSSSMRLRVQIDVNKPLMRVMRIRSEDDEVITVSFTYERLPNFCYLCGCLGHLSKFCSKRYEVDFSDPGENTPYGGWLRSSFRLSPQSHQNQRESRLSWKRRVTGA